LNSDNAPAPNLHFFRPTAGVAPGKKRRRQMEGQLEVPRELLAQSLHEFRVGVQAGDFVLVFVGHDPGES
jgi:hypothetical protein